MNIEGYHPLVKQHVDAYRAAIEAVYFSTYPKPCIDSDDSEGIAGSLAKYIQGINRAPNDFMAGFLKPGAVPFERQFQFSTVSGRENSAYHPGGKNEGWFYLDSNHSLFMGFSDAESGYTYFAVGSFISGKHGRNAYSCNFPIINQLQGVDLRSYGQDNGRYFKFATARNLMSRYRWEKALVALIVDWAQSEQIHSVYLLPGSLNRYFHKSRIKPEFAESLYMHYDVTAKRMGFRLQQNGLYGIYLPAGNKATV